MVPWKYHFGDGLYLIVEGDSAKWKTRYQKHGTQHWASLHLVKVADLVEARRRHGELKQQIADDRNPVEERRKARAAAKVAALARKTFRQCAEGWDDADGHHHDGYLDRKKKTEWKDRTFNAWKESLEYYVYPVIGDMDVNIVDRPDIKAVMERPAKVTKRYPSLGKLWDTRGDTAHYVRNRIELIIDWAIANRFRTATQGAKETRKPSSAAV
jgi:hypothetical protein